jgi:hypothetical protein
MLDFDEESLNNVLNNKICRICMSKNDKFNSLFECSLLNMIKSCLKIDVRNFVFIVPARNLEDDSIPYQTVQPSNLFV